MLIVTGVPSKVKKADSYYSYSERPAQPKMTDAMVYNLNSPTMCKLLEPYPRDVMGATGGLIANQYPVICGGLESQEPIKFCHSLNVNKQLNGSHYNMSMLEARAFAASIVLNNSILWVTGGHGINEEFLYTTEFVDIINEKSTPGTVGPISLKCPSKRGLFPIFPI